MNLFKRCSPYWANFIFFVLAFFAGHFAQSQSVGIGGEPNENAVLTITSGSKGLLIPRLTTAQRNAVPSPANGLMVYDTSLKCFFYYNDRQGWVDMKPTPAGMIVMWYGDIASNFNTTTGFGYGKMAGWALCDGNGRPDLRERFVVGGNGSNSGTTGGYATHLLNENTLPSHTHTISDPGHSHGTTLGGTFHSHTLPYSYGTIQSAYAKADDGTSITSDGGVTEIGHDVTTNSAVVNASISPASAGVSVNATGSGAPHENRPPYYVLAYIIKI